MKYCPKCGNPLDDNAAFCANCGTATGEQGPVYAQPVVQTDFTANMDAAETDRFHVLMALGYVSLIFGIIALIMEPNSKYVRFHMNQIVSLNVSYAVCSLAAIVPFIGWLACAVGYIMLLVFTIMGLVNTAKRRSKFLPIIGKFRILPW